MSWHNKIQNFSKSTVPELCTQLGPDLHLFNRLSIYNKREDFK